MRRWWSWRAIEGKPIKAANLTVQPEIVFFEIPFCSRPHQNITDPTRWVHEDWKSNEIEV